MPPRTRPKSKASEILLSFPHGPSSIAKKQGGEWCCPRRGCSGKFGNDRAALEAHAANGECFAAPGPRSRRLAERQAAGSREGRQDVGPTMEDVGAAGPSRVLRTHRQRWTSGAVGGKPAQGSTSRAVRDEVAASESGPSHVHTLERPVRLRIPGGASGGQQDVQFIARRTMVGSPADRGEEDDKSSVHLSATPAPGPFLDPLIPPGTEPAHEAALPQKDKEEEEEKMSIDWEPEDAAMQDTEDEADAEALASTQEHRLIRDFRSLSFHQIADSQLAQAANVPELASPAQNVPSSFPPEPVLTNADVAQPTYTPDVASALPQAADAPASLLVHAPNPTQATQQAPPFAVMPPLEYPSPVSMRDSPEASRRSVHARSLSYTAPPVSRPAPIPTPAPAEPPQPSIFDDPRLAPPLQRFFRTFGMPEDELDWIALGALFASWGTDYEGALDDMALAQEGMLAKRHATFIQAVGLTGWLAVQQALKARAEALYAAGEEKTGWEHWK